MTIGSGRGLAVSLDEVIVLRRAVDRKAVGRYVRAIRQMAQARYVLP